MLPGAELALRFAAYEQLQGFKAAANAGDVVVREVLSGDNTGDNTYAPDHTAEDPFYRGPIQPSQSVLKSADVERPDLGE